MAAHLQPYPDRIAAVLSICPAMIRVTRSISIPREELRFTYVRSGGPGGQNVNKTATKAVMRWDVAGSPSLADDVKARFQEKFANRLVAGGELILTSQRYRDQARNTEDCIEKLRAMILQVAQPPVPRTKTRPSRAAARRRLEEKRRLSEKKQSRRAL
mgnify:FL=1